MAVSLTRNETGELQLSVMPWLVLWAGVEDNFDVVVVDLGFNGAENPHRAEVWMGRHRPVWCPSSS
ncbi:hypothetical protein JMJ77_0009632 [Colletotrichum scovillei]|uniref:Uncharacterized protein n=1 Tax=Colletotrichum scovillei TaxID=1209932 RepID=A0A9P7U814_9PEZI|nr:hypothetical protein JMJ77_0009632 [Colletotrichum scovillei]KAG7052712.1 hypothetical protein JMJ78_0005726 [Colletotrichum scovillei]KAG7065005.1 hypothetical protein JMJ76_0012760 [Colletotrichum scovillei]